MTFLAGQFQFKLYVPIKNSAFTSIRITKITITYKNKIHDNDPKALVQSPENKRIYIICLYYQKSGVSIVFSVPLDMIITLNLSY